MAATPFEFAPLDEIDPDHLCHSACATHPIRAQSKVTLRCTLMGTLTWQLPYAHMNTYTHIHGTCMRPGNETYRCFDSSRNASNIEGWGNVLRTLVAAKSCRLDRHCTVKVRKHICDACAAMPQSKDRLQSEDQLRSKAQTQPHLQRALVTQNESLSAARIKRCQR